MSKIYLVMAEHFSVPGIVLKAFTTEASANAYAVKLAREIATEYDEIHDFDENDKSNLLSTDCDEILANAQDEYGAAHCYVTVEAVTVVE